MPDRTWIPSAYHDEIIPTPRASPSDWIVKSADGAFFIAPCDYYDHGNAAPSWLLTEGETIPFAWTVRLGLFDIKFDAAGAWSSATEIPRTLPDADVYFCFPGDPESVTEDLDDLLNREFQSDPESYAAEECTIHVFAWNKKEVNYTFTAGQFIEAPQ